jgi:hypothetical protein
MTTLKTYNDRLLKLADFLDTLPRKRFDFGCYVDTETWKGKPDLSCGTKACAMGWATTMPFFRRLGLRLNEDGIVCLKDDLDKPGNFFAEVDKIAGDKLFGLTSVAYEFLFVPQGTSGVNPLQVDATPKQVAKHIRKFVAKRTDDSR